MNPQLRAASLLAVLALASGQPAPARAANPVVVALTTGDGAKLSARYHPSAESGGKSPAVLILDDLGDDARPLVCDEVARGLAKEGCSVLCFDFRGTGKSRGVEPEFWDDPINQKFVKGYKADEPPETIRHADFKPGYLPTLVNDVAAARAFLERRNDARDCNTAQIYVIGFGRGATLGQVWLASEWGRYRVSGAQGKVATRPEGRDVAGCVWVGPQLTLDRQPVPMYDLLKRAEARRSTLFGLIHDAQDVDGARFARQCRDGYNVSSKAPLIVAHELPHETKPLAERGAALERAGKLIADMRRSQELPLWDNRNFVERRFVWMFRGVPLVTAKDDGDLDFQPVPLDHLFGKR